MPAPPAVPASPAHPATAGPGRRPPGQLTAGQLDRYARQLARCLKALGTDAPIRAEVQQELIDVRAEQHARATAVPAPGQDGTAGR
jgi:aminoglycoside phosphotransferase (APT) family kinase protein